MNTLDTLKRKWLALWIRCPKKPRTKGDILRYALYIYLKGKYYGLSQAVIHAAKHYHYKCDFIANNIHKIPEVFPLFRKEIAIRLFNGRDWVHWWPLEDWKSRYKYMRWLIREYNNVKL